MKEFSRVRQEAEKLTHKLDRDNETNKRTPLMHSREQFVQLMTAQLTKLLVHRTVLSQ